MAEPSPQPDRSENVGPLLPLVLADELSEGLVVIDTESTIRYANPAMTRIFGYGRDELVGEPLTILMPEGHRERHSRAFGRYLTTGERRLSWSEVELPGRHRGGHRLQLEISFTEFHRDGRRLFVGAIRDATGAKSPAEERRILAESYRALFEEDVAAAFRADPDGRILAANRALARAAGLEDPDELRDRHLTTLLAEGEARDRFLRDLRGGREVRNRELRLQRTDGTLRWSLVNAVWIDDPADGEPAALVGTVVDISDRKRAERELELSRERYRRLFEQELVGVFRSRPGPGGEIVECNQAIADMFGFDRPEGIEGTAARRLYPEGEDEREVTLEALREAGAFVHYELQLERKDGSPIWVLAHSRVVEEPRGRRLIEGLFFDVTDRVLARRELAEREERFRQMAENIEEVFWLRDRGAEEVLYVSPAYEEIWGRPLEELYERPDAWMEAIHPEDRVRIRSAVLESPEGTYDQEYRIVRPGGEVRWIHDRGFPVDRPDEPSTRMAGVAADITERVRARKALERAEEKWNTVFETVPTGIVISDPETGELLEMNEAFSGIFRAPQDRMLGRNSYEMGHWEDSERRDELVDRVRREGAIEGEEATFRTMDGRQGLMRVSCRAVEFGDRDALLWAIQDVTGEKEREAELRRSETRYRTLVETMAEATVILDDEGRITFANGEAEELLGLEASELRGRTYADPEWTITAPDGGPFPEARLPFRRVVRTGRPVRNVEHAIEKPDGSRRILSINAAPLPRAGEDRQAVVATMRDVTERYRMQEQLRHQALHDGLTELPNRTLFWDRLEHALDRSRRTGETVAVFFVDLDGFKRVNDEHGHAVGDEVLRQVARRLRSTIRNADTLARLGGDEFGVLLEGLDEPPLAEDAARRLTERFAPPASVAGEEILIRISCGVAVAGGGDQEERMTPDRLVHRADRAMYAAKEEPGSSYRVHGPELESGEPTRRLKREIELKEALEAGEVIPWFQPIVDLQDGRIVGGEALARWIHPGRGTVSPGEFIPLAEESGLIVELGRQVARAACARLAGWTEEGILPGDFRLHLNLSARELVGPDVVERLEELLRELDLEPGRVAVEVTETAAVESASVLESIRELGCPVGVDDFGTRYATLERLTALELDILKLDREFVNGIGRSKRHEAVLEASLTLAGSMGLAPVAEGIETEEQRRWLLEQGGRLAQGFLLSAPQPAGEFAELLRSGRGLPS